MKKILLLFIVTNFSCAYATESPVWRMQPLPDKTGWAALVGPNNALPEYPRPQLRRWNAKWKNLNGLWSFAITSRDSGKPSRYDGNILVPYPVESALSGVKRPLLPDQLLWYRRTFTVNALNGKLRVLLHFGAVDYRATVYVNGHEIGTHNGGYEGFTYDVTDSLRPGKNELVVKVFDPTDTGPNPHGKQTLEPQGIFYTASSGIWQTVWLEIVPTTHIDSVITTSDIDRSQVLVQVSIASPEIDEQIQLIAKDGNYIVSKKLADGVTALRIEHPHLWSPDDPFLYGLDVRVLKANGTVVDEVSSYFGLRSVKLGKDDFGKERIILNGRVTYNLGVLDQGFWPEGLYTAPTDGALKFDIQAAKAMGFNTIRKHVKVEPDRWYYYCDKLGMLVWQDMVPPGDSTPEAHLRFQDELLAILTQLRSHPSIVTWVLFNEGWGAFDQERLANEIRKEDPSRLLDAHSGANVEHLSEWEVQLDPLTLANMIRGDSQPFADELTRVEHADPHGWDGSDITDIHVYPGPQMPPDQSTRALVLGEHGGTPAPVADRNWSGVAGLGYPPMASRQLVRTYSSMVATLKSFESQGLSASIYTQLFDVEDELNGLMTYDRSVIKMPLGDIAKINQTLASKAANYATATRGFTAANFDSTSIDRRYATLISQFNEGDRSLPFLRRLTVLALEKSDQDFATQVGNEFIDRSPQPYSRDVWQFIGAITRTSRDRGFDILRLRSADADSVLGKDAAESVVRRIVGHEMVDFYAAENNYATDWDAIERRVLDKYGMVGEEKVYGTEMIYYLGVQDWPRFAKYYVRYFGAAKDSDEYPFASLSHTLLSHVSDLSVLESAARIFGLRLSSRGIHSGIDPVDLDVYASLLYRVGRRNEAIEWEEKAEQLSGRRDKHILAHLEQMKRGTGI